MLNYRRAWTEFVVPEFLRIYPLIFDAYNATAAAAANMRQIKGGTQALTNVTDSLENLFLCIRPETLARAAEIVYWHGHLATNGSSQGQGLYWKFQILARQSLIERGHQALMRQEQIAISGELSKYVEDDGDDSIIQKGFHPIRETIFDR